MNLTLFTSHSEGVEEYASRYLDWFQEHGFLYNSVPVTGTIARIIGRIELKQLRQWVVKKTSRKPLSRKKRTIY